MIAGILMFHKIIKEKNEKTKISLLIASFIFFLFVILFNETLAINAVNLQPCEPQDVACLLKKVENKNWQERELGVTGLEGLPPQLRTSEVRDALIHLLEKEAARKNPLGGYSFTSEGEAEYFNYLCKVVGRSNDPRAIPLLADIGALYDLIPFGGMVVDLMLTKLEDKNPGQRGEAATVLNIFLTPKEKGYTVEGEARQKIRKALLKAAKDEEGFVRGRVVTALSNFQDDEVVATLENLKNNDTYYIIGKNTQTGEKGIKRYTVREAAEKALEKIKKSKGQ